MNQNFKFVHTGKAYTANIRDIHLPDNGQATRVYILTSYTDEEGLTVFENDIHLKIMFSEDLETGESLNHSFPTDFDSSLFKSMLKGFMESRTIPA
jgi:hypothetical protein